MHGSQAHVLEVARAAFRNSFGTNATRAAWAPGRVNLIGEHTDYNEGFVLPMAIERGVAVAFTPRGDDLLRVHSVLASQTRELFLETLRRRVAVEPEKRGQRGGWFGYVAGVAWAMLGAGIPLRGADMAIAADLPAGAGLSSSAALEIAIARALAADLEWDPAAIALLAQRAEHEFAGVACGIMDQLSVAAATAGNALLIDCRSLETRNVPVPEEVAVIVFDSGVRRDLQASAYNDRRAACERAAQALREVYADVRALRDVDQARLEHAKDRMDGEAYKRAQHVVAENLRPGEMSLAFESGDLVRAGRLMIDSHASLRNLFDASTFELDTLAGLCTGQRDCFGARLTGAGWGGCVVALARRANADAIGPAVVREYGERTGRAATAFVCRPAAGAHLI